MIRPLKNKKAKDLALLKKQSLSILEGCRARLLLSQPFTANLLLRLNLVPVDDDRCPTACTDGYSVFYSIPYLLQQTEEERVFVLAHETWHCALQHLKRSLNRSGLIWNLAVDAEVNSLLLEQGFDLPAGAVIYPDWQGQNAESIYNFLIKSSKIKKYKNWDYHLDETERADRGGKRKDPDYTPGYYGDCQREWRNHLAEAVVLNKRSWGKGSDLFQSLMENLVQPVLNWKKILADFISRNLGGGSSWLPPDRRMFSLGVYLPSSYEDMLKITVVVDVSGSMTAELKQVFSEVKGIAEAWGQYAIRVIQFDDGITKIEVFENDDGKTLGKIGICGGGGTDIRPVFDYLNKENNDDAVVVLTDGCFLFPKDQPNYPVIWGLTVKTEVKFPWGEVFIMDSKKSANFLEV